MKCVEVWKVKGTVMYPGSGEASAESFFVADDHFAALKIAPDALAQGHGNNAVVENITSLELAVGEAWINE